jgi:membrane fusion protein, multidrug efflux system
MKSPIKSRRVLIGIAILAVVGVAASVVVAVHGSGNSQAAENKVPATLEFGRTDLSYLENRALERSLTITGTLQATRQAVVKAQGTGNVRTISVREGDPVTAGEVLARLDTADLEARLAEKVSSRDSAKAQFELADKTRATNQALLERKFISQNAYDSADSTFKANHASMEAANAQVDSARIALSYATIASPIAGIVSKRYVQVGEKASMDTPMFSIVDLDSLELQALVPAGEVGSLERGMSATFTVDGMTGQSFSARVDRISPATEPGTRSIIVFLTVPNPEHRLKSGMFASGTLELGKGKPVATLPIAAIQSEAGQSVVWTVEDRKITRRPVEVGLRDIATGYVEIRSGVAAGVPVLATKMDDLKEGAPALVKAAAAAPAKS